MESFFVHENLLRSSLPHLLPARSNRTVHLQHDSPEVFAIYLHWLYYGTLPTKDTAAIDPDPTPEYLDLATACAFGAKFECFEFHNAAMDALVTMMNKNNIDNIRSPDILVKYAYSRPASGKALHRVLVDMYLCHATADLLDRGNWEHGHNIQDFLLDIARGSLGRDLSKCEPLDPSNYHI
ncbi:uncharacterized protein DSM5745_00109 [Aspergillus mulundensis]|uniref:BTB domain-containing protein n=1 Tax=Aspergillus mulundensis TaxID=1810919 RepID=A0A3D8T2J5_9EURO|nr:hypothetical protein DSM5745_00109 [Aspergillus mulundensis]RDW92787.1 hypothetical protein DSM5745_00109 [Aspergillus mulundensis]